MSHFFLAFQDPGYDRETVIDWEEYGDTAAPFQLEFLELALCGKGLDELFVRGTTNLFPVVAMESIEENKVWLDPLWKAFAYIKDLIIRITSRIMDFFAQWFRTDIRTKDQVNVSQARVFAFIQNLPSADRRDLEEGFARLSVSGMVPFKEFRDQIQTMGELCEHLIGVISQDILHRVKDIANPFKTDTQFAEMLDPATMAKLKTLHIDVDAKGKVQFQSPYKKASATSETLGALNYHRVNQVWELGQHYQQSWNKYLRLRELNQSMKTLQRELEQKERDMHRHDVKDKDTILNNLRYVQRHVSLLLHLFMALRDCNAMLNYRRLKLINCIEKVLQLINRPIRKSARPRP